MPSAWASAVVNAGSMPADGTVIVRGAACDNSAATSGPRFDRSGVPPTTAGTITGVPELTSKEASLLEVFNAAIAVASSVAAMPGPFTTRTSLPPLETNVRFWAITAGDTDIVVDPISKLIGAATAGRAIVVNTRCTSALVTLGSTGSTAKTTGADDVKYAFLMAATALSCTI